MKAAIIVNLSKEAAIRCSREIISLLHEQQAQVCMPIDAKVYFSGDGVRFFYNMHQLFAHCDAAITVGGDGTIIHAAKYAAEADTPLIGVNVGRLGFAAEVEPDEIQSLARLNSGDYETESRLLLEVVVQKPSGESRYLAVNDAVVAHGQLSKIVDLSLAVDGETVAQYRSDGLLFSTFSRSVVFESSAELSVSVKIPQGCSCLLTVDGEVNIDIAEEDRVIIRQSPLHLTLISLKKRNFYSKLNEKLREREIV